MVLWGGFFVSDGAVDLCKMIKNVFDPLFITLPSP